MFEEFKALIIVRLLKDFQMLQQGDQFMFMLNPTPQTMNPLQPNYITCKAAWGEGGGQRHLYNNQHACKLSKVSASLFCVHSQLNYKTNKNARSKNN